MAIQARWTGYQAAQRTTRELEKIFDRLGNARHPRGRILGAYRNARRALRDVQSEPYPIGASREVLQGLRRDVHGAAREALGQARALGMSQAEVEAEVWDLGELPPPFTNVEAELSAWMGVVDLQITKVNALIQTDADPALWLGDELRQGIVQPAPVIKEGTRWLTIVAMSAWLLALEGAIARSRRGGLEWFKQVVPCIDGRTTNCCLTAAGQAVPFREKFELKGTPRYADEMEWTPFHDYCRTSVVMVPRSHVEDDLTARVLTDAAAEQARRDLAAERAAEIRQALVTLGTLPDGRRRSEDTEQISELRRELAELNRRAE